MKHGTVSCYRHAKCRCDLCRAAKATQAAAYRKSVNGQARQTAFNATEERRAYMAAYNAAYNARADVKEKAAIRYAAYTAREDVKAKLSARNARAEVKAAKRAYDLSSKGKAANRRNSATRRARIAGVFDEVVDVDILYIRDGGICQICNEPVDWNLEWPDPKSRSHDHIHPVAKQGRHSYDNAQLAHLGCNCAKHAKVPA